MAPGAERGQFDVWVDGERVASKSRSLWVRILRSGFPDPEDVVAEVLRRRAPGRGPRD